MTNKLINWRFMAVAVAFASAIALSTPAHSQAVLPFIDPLFTDNMVLQRGMKDAVWGWTTPGAKVTVQIGGKTATGTAGSDGKWVAKIGPFSAGGPYTLSISGPQSVTFDNVLIGDVWVCSGQSNMEFGVGREPDVAQITAAADNPQIRIYTVLKSVSATPLATTDGKWQAVTPDTIMSQGTWNGFSAVGYFFGKDIQADQHIPIGLLQSSWGGTPAEAWTAKEELYKTLPVYRPQIDLIQTKAPIGLNPSELAWYTKFDQGTAANWQDPNTDTSSWKPITLPGYFQQAGVLDLANINGVVWFRSTFDLPAADLGKDAVMNALVDDNDTTWVNGILLGSTEGFSIQRAYKIPASILKPTGNVVVIRDLDTGGVGGVWGTPENLKVTCTDEVEIPLAGTWQYKIGVPLTQAGPYPSPPQSNLSSSYPTALYNGMISPITTFGIKGTIWYQGENNDGKAPEYKTLLPTMITSWRDHWGQGNFPFLIVQLAGFGGGPGTWPIIRQAQWITAQTLPNTGIATAVDIGEQWNIHPANKAEVGRRLALVAEKMTYRENVVDSGPVYQSMKLQGSSIRLMFKEIDGGLVALNGAPLTGFQIAGSDGKFVDAVAKIDGDTVVVSSPTVLSPVAVQYAWSEYPACSLYNAAGLPAFPFTTD